MKNRNLHHILLVIIILQITISVFAREKNQLDTLPRNPIQLEGRVHYGFCIAHHPEMEYLTRKHFPMFELSVLTNTTGRHLWEAQCHYPTFGASFLYSSLSHPALGELFGLYPFIDFPLVQSKRHDYLAFRVGLGLGWLTRPFDRINNYHNFAYGSHINALIHFELHGKIHLTKRLSTKIGATFTHLSNGTTKEPNFGLNIPAVVLGVEYQLNNTSGEHIPRTWSPKQPFPYRLVLDLYGSGKDISEVESPIYFTGNLSVNLLKQYRPCRSWGVGIDFDYDASDIAIKKQNNEYEGPEICYVRVGAKVMHQWHIQRLLIGVQFGGYLFTRDKSDGYFYDFLTLGYQITDHIYAGIALKTHWAKADYIGVGIRTTLWKSKVNQ